MFSRVCGRRARLVVATGLAAAFAMAGPTNAEAKRLQRKPAKAAARAGYTPPFAAMVVDANTGKVLHADSAHELRHPASVTKVMTLYLLFEQLERGALALDSELKMSRNAASQPPSKLGVPAGGTIEVEDAIKALVTKSANDVACAIAENLAGSEEEFAEKMTRKARQLGMRSTVYKNASGLPNREQVTTARDLTILARAIQERFPKHYKYFQTRSFAYGGRVIGNHNRLLGRVEGVDGIKTGFTNASGFNLMTSARLDGRHVVGVVLGGRSGASRDNIMAGLIRTNLGRAYAGSSTSSVLAEAGEGRRALASAEDVETTASLSPSAPKPFALASALAAPAAALGLLPQAAEPPAAPSAPGGKIEARLLSASGASSGRAEPTPRVEAARVEPPRPEREPVRAEPARPEPEPKREAAAKPASVTPWVIQLAAEKDERKALGVLEEAKSRAGRALSRAAPFTEKIVRGDATLWRARFSGFAEAETAQAACDSLKRSGFACFATRS